MAKYMYMKFGYLNGAYVYVIHMRTFYMAINLLCVLCSRVDEEGFEVIAQLVILLRLWRIVRVVNGIILSSKSQNDNALHEAKGEARKVIHMLHKTRTRLTEELVSLLNWCNCSF